MDVSCQAVSTAQTQVAGTDAASGKKGQVQALASAEGKSEKGSASFGKLLVQTIGSGNAPTEAGTGLSAVPMLNGLPLALPTAASSEDKSAQEILEAFAGQPELADLLKNDGDFEQWLVRVSELLQGMLLIPQPAVQTPEAGAQGIVEASSGQGQTVSVTQAQQVITALQQAVSENPDSILLGQLTDDLVKLVADRLPEASVSMKEYAVSLRTNHTQAQMKASADFIHADYQLDGAVPTKEPAVSVHAVQAQNKASEALIDADLQTVTGDSHALHLEMLAAKASFSDRFSKDGQQQSETNSSAQKESAVLSGAGTVPVHELIRLAQSGKSAAATFASTPDTLVQDLSNFVTARFKVNDFSGLAEARLTLTPESLGQVDVKLSLQNGQLIAHFAAQTVTGKEMLEAQMLNLRLALQNQGIQVEKLEVTQNGSLQSGMFQEQRHQQSSQQFTRRSKTSSGEQFQETYSTEAINPSSAFLAVDRTGFDATV